MKRIIPINDKGDQIGPAKRVSDLEWETMQKTFGKKLRWREQAPKPSKDVEVKLKPKSKKRKKDE